MLIKKINYYVRYMSAELYSVGLLHYFTYNGNIFKLTKEQLKKSLIEIKKANMFNPLASANILIKMAKAGKFKNITRTKGKPKTTSANFTINFPKQ